MVGKTGKKTKTAGRGPARGRGVLMSRNAEEAYSNLMKEYEVFLERLEEQIRRMEEQKAEELRLLDGQESDFFHRQCNLYTDEQLNMPLTEFEILLEAEETAKLQHANDPPSTGDQNEIPHDEPIVFKIPIKGPPKKRRSSLVYNAVAATPVWRPSRGPKMPKFVSRGTGIKNMQPRLARIGELAYTENGSPIIVGDSTKKTLQRRGKMALATAVLDERF